jgi:serine/threonine-protein kinase
MAPADDERDPEATPTLFDAEEPPAPDELPVLRTVLAARSPFVGVADRSELVQGDQSTRYFRNAELARGAQGEVDLYQDRWIGREVALKRLRSGTAPTEAQRARFLREMRVQGQLEHPSIVPVYDFGADRDGELYFTMRRVHGATLEEVIAGLKRGDRESAERYTRRRLLEAFARICLAVHYGHTRGVLHRDLKPANLMLGRFGEVYVLDWGVAKVIEGASLQAEAVGTPGEVSAPGRVVGTPAYMAPEQMLGKGAIDARADVYSLGVMLFELLALKPLLEGSLMSVIGRVSSGTVRARPSEHARDVAPELDAICERAAAPRAADRFASALELSQAVEGYLDGDRDAARRRERAGEHTRVARAAAERAREAERTGGASAQADRAEALREALRALAFDAAQADAQELLEQLMVIAPERVPPEVATEMSRADETARLEGARLALRAYLMILAVLPFALWLGVRSWPPFLLGVGMVVVSLGYAAFLSRKPRVRFAESATLALINAAMVASVSCWVGPFVVAPQVMAVSALLFASYATRRERPLAIAFSALGALAPLALELLRLVPPSMAFEGGRMLLLPRSLELPRMGTIAALTYVSLAFVVVPAILLGRVRDALAQAQGQLFLQAWQLRRLVADVVRSASTKD